MQFVRNRRMILATRILLLLAGLGTLVVLTLSLGEDQFEGQTALFQHQDEPTNSTEDEAVTDTDNTTTIIPTSEKPTTRPTTTSFNRTSMNVFLHFPYLQQMDPQIQLRWLENIDGFLNLTSMAINLHILTDETTFKELKTAVERGNYSDLVQMRHHSIVEFQDVMVDLSLNHMGGQEDFAEMMAQVAYPALLHKYFTRMDKLLYLTPSLSFHEDPALLYEHFRNFSSQNIIGVAHEQSPKYSKSFNGYRTRNRKTNLGHAPPAGLPGFDASLILLNLGKMRESLPYNSNLHYDNLRYLLHKYMLAKEENSVISLSDIFLLFAIDQSQLFYVLPCEWNRLVTGRQKYEPKLWAEYNNCPSNETYVVNNRTLALNFVTNPA